MSNSNIGKEKPGHQVKSNKNLLLNQEVTMTLSTLIRMFVVDLGEQLRANMALMLKKSSSQYYHNTLCTKPSLHVDANLYYTCMQSVIMFIYLNYSLVVLCYMSFVCLNTGNVLY